MYLEYPSSLDASLRLFADFAIPPEPRRLLVQMHGWHGQVKSHHADNLSASPAPEWFVIRPEMRGRGDATGKPDCNGWELQDVVDAVEFTRQRFPEHILRPELVALTGGSGGGGNVMALVGKFPDYFCCAVAECGISDYALWYRDDVVGEFRDEMNIWIGGSPDEHPEAYASRSGITTAANLLTPLLLFHGERDARVPAEQSRRFVAEARRHGRGHLVTYHEFPGVGGREHYGQMTAEQREFLARERAAFLHTHARLIHLPPRGQLVVAGYLKTRQLEVILNDISCVATVDYDLERGEVEISAPTAAEATVCLCLADGRRETRLLRLQS